MMPFAARVTQDIGSEKPELLAHDRSGPRHPCPGRAWDSRGPDTSGGQGDGCPSGEGSHKLLSVPRF